MTESDNVASIASLKAYKPTGKTHRVAFDLTGEAASNMSELMATFRTNDPNVVALRAIALLISAQGKDIILRDPKTGATETIEA